MKLVLKHRVAKALPVPKNMMLLFPLMNPIYQFDNLLYPLKIDLSSTNLKMVLGNA